MLKSEYAEQLGVTVKTLSVYLNKIFYQELLCIGYNKFQKILYVKHIKFLNEKLCNY